MSERFQKKSVDVQAPKRKDGDEIECRCAPVGKGSILLSNRTFERLRCYQRMLCKCFVMLRHAFSEMLEISRMMCDVSKRAHSLSPEDFGPINWLRPASPNFRPTRDSPIIMIR